MDESGINRVTNPERYALLHRLADRVLDELEDGFRVRRTEGADLDRALLGESPDERVVRLTPADRREAPRTVNFTGFPGLAVRFGRWYAEIFPRCGCDYCDESPDEMAEEFRGHVSDLVAGRFAEWCDDESGSVQAEFRGANGLDFSRGGGTLGGDQAATDIPEPSEDGWEPWTRRTLT